MKTEKKLQKHIVTIEVTTDKPVPNLAAHAVGRIYTLDGVEDCICIKHEQVESPEKVKDA